MSALHQVYRCETSPQCHWRGYVIADDATVEADSLSAARTALADVLARRAEPWIFDGVVEHTEHALAPGLWIREALDTRAGQRGQVTRVLAEALHDPRLAQVLHELPEHPAGGTVLAACLPGDRLSWILEQHEEPGNLVVATALSNHRIWYNALTSTPSETAPAKTLADLGLNDPHALLDDWIVASPTGTHIHQP